MTAFHSERSRKLAHKRVRYFEDLEERACLVAEGCHLDYSEALGLARKMLKAETTFDPRQLKLFR